MDSPPATASDAVAAWMRRNLKWVVLGIAFCFFLLPRIAPSDSLREQLDFFRDFSEWTLAKIEDLFESYGYYVVFFGVLLENSLFFGLIVPGAIILILAGLSAENGEHSLPLFLGLAIAATILGDTASFFIGRLGWTRALERGSMGKMMDKVRGPMESNSTWLILCYHFAGYSRVVGPTAAGLFRIPYRKWAPLDYIGGTAWVLAYTAFGVLLGAFGLDFGDTSQTVKVLEWFFMAIFVVMIVAAFARTSRRPGEPRPPAARGRGVVIEPVERESGADVAASSRYAGPASVVVAADDEE